MVLGKGKAHPKTNTAVLNLWLSFVASLEECATGEGFFSSSTISYDANTPIEVQVSKDIFVIFSVR